MDLQRRDLILGAVGAFGLPIMAHGQNVGSGAVLPLWPGSLPGGGGPVGPVQVNQKGAISNIAIPALEVFLPRRPNGIAILVAGGGGYKRIEMESEARPAARWLAAQGITAFVLRYRLPGEGWRDGPLAPLQDAQRALRVIAGISSRYGIDTARIEVLGFSAGGHLLGLAATRSGFASYRPVDALDTAQARAAKAALIYPVITLLPPYDHTSTRVELVGHHPTREESALWSVETHVHGHCPPLFLVQAQDDPISNIANTAMLEQAARQAGIAVERHVLPSGGHGFGMGQPGTPSAAWPAWYQDWLKRA